MMMVKPGLVDRALELVSPAAAARRLAARMSLQNLKGLARDYDGASRGRGAANWRAANNSANAEIETALPLLRARMRDLVRNNPIAANAVQVLVSNLVGTGIRPRAATNDATLNATIDALWSEFSAQCDFFGHTDFHGLTALVAREMIEGGDVLALQRIGPRRAGSRVPLKIEVKEADHLDDSKIESTAVNGRRISQGIEYDREGRRAAYWLYPDHPGDILRNIRNVTKSERVPADRVCHVFERQRTQDRGVPWGAPVMRALRDLDDWQNAEMVRKKTEACLVGIVLGDTDTQSVAPQVKLADGSAVQEFGPGMIAYANGATDVKFTQPASTGGVYEWNKVQLHMIAAGFRVPYSVLTGDLSQANFASSRVGLNEFRRMIEMMQWQILIPKFCQPVWDWFITAAYLNGNIGVDRVAVEWAPPRFESVNPKQDAEADLLEVRAGFASTPQMIAKRGYDPDQVLKEQSAYLAKANIAKVVVDSDPSKVSKGGQQQPTQPDTSE
jgi:lambda family phage portal protein